MIVTIEKSDLDPRGYRLTTELRLAAPREKVFAFFSDAFQLETITPPWMHFSVQTPGPIEMQSGTLIDYKLRVHGWPMRWRSRISLWEPPLQFVDEQVKGPYRYWLHLHAFQDVDGGTLVRDVVHYSLPLRRILHPLLVRRDLVRIFEYRRATMSQMVFR
jgi:ligand-binding SRPBCC domain-containing protein